MGMKFCRTSCFRKLQMLIKSISRRAPHYKRLQDNAWREEGQWVDLGNLGGPSSSSSHQGGMALAVNMMQGMFQGMQENSQQGLQQLATIMSSHQMAAQQQLTASMTAMQTAMHNNTIALLREQRERGQMGPEAFDRLMQQYWSRQRHSKPPPDLPSNPSSGSKDLCMHMHSLQRNNIPS